MRKLITAAVLLILIGVTAAYRPPEGWYVVNDKLQPLEGAFGSWAECSLAAEHFMRYSQGICQYLVHP